MPRTSLRWASTHLRGRATFVALSALAVFLSAVVPWTTPVTDGKDLKPPRWPDGKTLRFFVQNDPDANSPDRSALIKEGMDRWIAQMAPRGITIEVTVGAVPDPGGHVALILITMDVQPQFIVQVTPPPGWAHFDPRDPLRTDRDYAYYQDYLEDGATTTPPWVPGPRSADHSKASERPGRVSAPGLEPGTEDEGASTQAVVSIEGCATAAREASERLGVLLGVLEREGASLQGLVDAWPRLPEAIRKAVLALVAVGREEGS